MPEELSCRAGRLLWLLAAAAVSGQAGGRDLSRAVLMQGTSYPQPIDLQAYTPPVDAPVPGKHFEGRLGFTASGRNGYRSLHVDRSFLGPGHRQVDSLPDFDFDFVVDSGDIIPARRGAMPGSHPSWEIIVEPGRAWDSAEDGDYTRAALPFALEERNENCMHNGMLTFLIRSDGRISHAAWQISSETCSYEKFDAWGWLRASYRPQPVAGAGTVVAAYRQEVAGRLPTKPVARLAVDYPGAQPASFGNSNDVAPGNMTTFGYLIDGTHYTGGCPTRHGEYPFCDVLDLPSYSLAKSIVGAIALMRLEQLYPGAAQARIRDYVPECARDHRWDGVTFANVLDMATGLYASTDNQTDENAPGTARFFFPADHAHKIRYACREYARQEPPGHSWVYHTSDTYVLGTAIQRYWRQRHGPTADFYRDLLVEPLWRQLGLSPPVAVTRRTYDSVAQPFTGYGLTLHGDDIAKLALFLSAGGSIAGQQMLDPVMLGQALQRDLAHPGLPAGGDEFRYAHGFWAYDAARALGCAGETWIPFMSGFGGIVVAMLPNGTVYYYVSDGNEFRWVRAAAESNRIRRFCQP